MTKEIEISVEPREGRKKGAARKIRRQGKIPAVLYGPDRKDNIMMVVDPRKVLEAIKHHGESVLFKLKPEGKFPDNFAGCLALIRDIQRDPVTYKIIHVDFLELSEKREVEVEVAIKFVGIPKGLKAGGILHTATEKVKIYALPRNIPEFIELDISELQIGSGLKAKDIALPEGTRLAHDPNDTIVQVLAPVAEEAKPKEEVAAKEAVTAQAAEKEAAPAEEAAKKGAKETSKEKKPEKTESKKE